MQAPLVVLYEVWHLSHHLVIMVIENDEFIPHSAFQNDIICPKIAILMSRAGAHGDAASEQEGGTSHNEHSFSFCTDSF